VCGIAGVAGAIARPEAERAVRGMMRDLARRGPDGEGLANWDGAVLGHRRLAILDLSDAGLQPMVAADRSVGVVFNGAIYNHRDLRRELRAGGFDFRSRTDSEVLLHGYRAWGLDAMVARLHGMFAFGLWDERLVTLYLVRDRLGVKPLAYAARGPSIAFASTPRALRSAGFVAELDEAAVAEFLDLGFVTDARAIYRGAAKVPAGTIVEWCGGALRRREYWRPPAVTSAPAPTFVAAVEETERLLLRAVEARLHADASIAALLSGGIDSALVCWAVRRLGGDVTALTIATPGHAWDEAAAASVAARAIGIDHRVLPMSDHDAPEIEALVAAYAEPFASASALGLLRVSRIASATCKVLLTGEGGDDVFLGYPRQRRLWLSQALARRLPAGAARAWFACRAAVPAIGPFRRAAALLDNATEGLPAVVGRMGDGWRSGGREVLGERLRTLQPRPGGSAASGGRADRVLAEFLEFERRTRFVGEYLTKLDGATMYHGLEARSPFLDHTLWEYAAALPFGVRLRHGRLKAVLRELARRRIGHRVANRPKQGFGIPVERWMVGRWLPRVEAAFNDSLLVAQGWIDRRALLSQLEQARRRAHASTRLWRILVLEAFVRQAGARTPLEAQPPP
jgi:asparagine synthase (glutamine-hydrolysing)